MKKTIAALVLVGALGTFALPASASSPASGSITKSKRSLKWSGASFVLSDPAPDPTGLDLYAPSCHTDSTCDHFALKITLGNKARIQIKIMTPRPNPPGSFAGVTSLQPVTGDDYDLYVYDPSGALITGAQGTTEKGNETVTFTHLKKFNGKAYDVAVRPWAVAPGSTYSGFVKALSVGK